MHNHLAHTYNAAIPYICFTKGMLKVEMLRGVQMT